MQSNIYDTIINTIENKDLTLYLVLDEAHRGMKPQRDRATIVQRLINGQGLVPAIPVVFGISATVERFTRAMAEVVGRTSRTNVTVDVERVRALAPTHLVVNVDENPRPIVEELAAFIPHVIVTHPIEPEDNLSLYRLMGGIFDREVRAGELCRAFAAELDATREAARHLPREEVLYLIWRSPWMTVSRDTYISRMLDLVGWDTVPAQAHSRYPSVDLTPQLLRNVRHVLLSTEPYSFVDRHIGELSAELPPQVHPEVSLIDGGMTSWYGSRAIEGLRYLRELRSALSG